MTPRPPRGMADTDPADQLLAQERAQRPRWRNAAARPAPAWFRGEELELVEPPERRQLYDAAKARLAPVPWASYLTVGMLGVFIDVRHAWSWHWPMVAAVAVWIAGAAASTILRRRLIRRFGRDALRESSDWPQRLAQLQA